MARTRHNDDHIRVKDEAFKYRGKAPEQLAQVFLNSDRESKILIVQGFTSCGKTRFCKEYARKVAEGLRKQSHLDRKKVHTFYYDLREFDSVGALQRDLLRDLQDNIPAWQTCGELKTSTDFIKAFKAVRNGYEQVYVIILDNVERVSDRERPNMLAFIEDVTSDTNNVYLVVASRKTLKFIRNMCIKTHHIGDMDLNDAKELLKETSGNPPDLDKYADKIVHPIRGSPLAVMIAGYEMNPRHHQLPFTPEEFLEVMEDSTCLTFGLENVPQDDRLFDRVKEIVSDNFSVLEKVVVAVDYPEGFHFEELKRAMHYMSDGKIKQSILHIILNGSLYSMHINTGKVTSSNSFESAPFLMKVLKETFCQMTSKDIFLREFNATLIQTVDKKELMTSRAKELRKAALHLLKQQEGQRVTPEELSALRKNVISKATTMVDEICFDMQERESFQTSCNDLLIARETIERKQTTRYESQKGIQETGSLPHGQGYPVACSSSPSKVYLPSSKGTATQNGEKEAEACLSPTFPSEMLLPGLKEINKKQNVNMAPVASATCDVNSADQTSEVGYVVRSADATQKIHTAVTDQQGAVTESLENNDRKQEIPDNLPSVVTKVQNYKASHDQQMAPVIEATSNPVVNGDEEVLSRYATLSSRGEAGPTVSQSPCASGHPSSGPSDLFMDSEDRMMDLSNNIEQSLSIREGDIIGSLHSKDIPSRPAQGQEGGHQYTDTELTYSAQSTMPDQRVLVCPLPKNLKDTGECRRAAQQVLRNVATVDSRKKAVESEYDWEESCRNEQKIVQVKHGEEMSRHAIHGDEIGEGQAKHPERQQPKSVGHSGTYGRGSRGRPDLHVQIRPPQTRRHDYDQSGHYRGLQHAGHRLETGGRGLLGPAPQPSPHQGLGIMHHQQPMMYQTARVVQTQPPPWNNYQYTLPSEYYVFQNSGDHNRTMYNQGNDYPPDHYSPDRYYQEWGPPSHFPSPVSTPSLSFQPRGPPLSSQQWCPDTPAQLQTNGFQLYSGPGYGNNQPERGRGYAYQGTLQHQEGSYHHGGQQQQQYRPQYYHGQSRGRTQAHYNQPQYRDNSRYYQ